MSLDRSFSTSAALSRLLARCPALGADPCLLALASAPAAPTWDDVAAALAEPLLHPRYTVPIIGCFRPLAPALVDHASELLRTAAPALLVDSVASQEEEVGEGDARVVEFYLSRGRGLRLHELACLALSRALDLAPHLIRRVLKYFKFSPPPFQRLLREGVPSLTQCVNASLKSGKGLHLFLDATQVSYRFLELEPRVFCEQWDWSCFLDLVNATMRKSHEVALMAVSQRWPVLLYGPVGAGKTALINELAQNRGNRVLFIHMDEQMDGRTLVGSYVCTEKPGEFKWAPGSLTQAIVKGFWIVFEDIDKAPTDVQSILLPLLEGSSSFSIGHAEAVEVADGFRLFATVTTSKHDFSHALEGRLTYSGLWRKVMLGEPNREDMVNIVNGCYPSLDTISSKLIDTFEKVNSLVSYQFGGLNLAGGFSDGILHRFSLRDLLKWCKRIVGVDLNFEGLGLASSGYQFIYYEALIQKGPFADIRSALDVLERVACSIKFNEPVLLVGETGTGKTTLVQNLASWLKQSLTVVNLSQQSDISDLLGGFKPTDARSICFPLYMEFKDLFCQSFSKEANEDLLRYFDVYVMEKNWVKLLNSLAKCAKNAHKLLEGKKRKRSLGEWDSLFSRLNVAHSQLGSASGMSFQFAEGAFVSALRNGHWILLDEVNLAPPETLQRIGAVLDGEKGTLCLAERGDVDYIERHPRFRMFACMNPATDAGKRELPYAFRSRFTECFVDDLMDDDDLRLFASKYLDGLHTAKGVIDSIVCFYKAAKKESEEKLQDGANQKPQFTLRSLSRALGYVKIAEKSFGFRKALYDGFCMFFLTMLDVPSAKIIKNIIVSLLLNGRVPPSISFADYFVEKPKQLNDSESDEFLSSYVLTSSVTEHIVNLARAVYIKRYPVLLQGPTSSGKTSLVRYLAAKTGHEFVRINNHEHTDLQEYLGTYVPDSHGKLQFQEGALVKAVREGHWIVLDELNLAPSDVLEALNRLLDDNRELFVPELQETIPAHPNFMLFATQNPPVLYGGRKMLSRAFRNRFIEVNVDEIPEDELITILEQRCIVARSYATKMVQVMKDLQMHRQNSRVFAGRHGFITPRDLFRWANRYRTFEGKSYEDLAKDGYLLLAERLRDDNEKIVVQEALERHLRVKLNIPDLYNLESIYGESLSSHAIRQRVQESFGQSREPVLLVGETGGGKTTVCQVLSAVLGVKLHILNCHQYTETSDFIGGFSPVRDRSTIALEYKHLISTLKGMKIFIHVAGDVLFPSDISGAISVVNRMNEILDRYRKEKELFPEVPPQDIDDMEQIKLKLMHLHQKSKAIFLWQDGPLVQAMKSGDLFLIDEVSLADDSVLERLNSVLEPERKLSLAEQGGSVLEKIVAHPNFFILATMNPGGDYGKKELSPALRNRFTELWVPAVTDVDELKSIAVERFSKAELSCFGDCIVNFLKWFNHLHTGRMLTIRDLLSWISFINLTEMKLGSQQALIHGLFLVLLDGLTLGMNLAKSEATELRRTCMSFILEELRKVEGKPLNSRLNDLKNYGWGDDITKTDIDCNHPDDFGIAPFYITKGHFACKQQGFLFTAPTTSKNVLRVLRGMQLPKPLLLEGSPGVGKTSLIMSLAGFSGHNVVRINLSEQTDMMDLLGSDLPLEGENGIEFAWSDGILLQALKNGSWVLLDELNLAPQSVLEGLNAILDHRAEVYIPELGQTYKCPQSFRVFACQNPSSQGGGRKGLPKSFLNRFTKVYVDELKEDDYFSICKSEYPLLSDDLLRNLICFNNRLFTDTMIHRKYGQEGSPWEFNLRDIMRSCQMIADSPDTSKNDCFLNTVYLQRMRTAVDRNEVLKLFEEVFQIKPSIHQSKMLYVNAHCLVVGNASIRRNNSRSYAVQINQLNILPGILHSLEAAIHCIHQGWLCILVGQHSSGKTSLIRLLAQLSGNTVNELNLSSATDVSELLGCFEQYNFFRHYKEVISQVERYVNEYFSLSMDIRWKKDLIMMKSDLELLDLPISLTKDDLSKTLKSIYSLQQKEALHQPVKFEWVAGDLIRAIERGEWVILDNANLCNPTVLDRINSLFEKERSIVVNECGLVDGNPVVLKAHPNFRMFLTVNAKYGEVSRAMRNRGVEIFLMEQSRCLEGCPNVPENSERKDVTRFLISCGVPRMELISSMTEAHLYAKAAGLRLGINITILEITRWVQLFQQLLIKGNQLSWSLHLSWEHTYLPSLGQVSGSDVVEEGKLRFLTNVDGCSAGLPCDFSLSLPGGWPIELKLRDFIWYSKESCVQRNCMYLQSLGAQYAAYQLSNLEGSSSLIGPSNIHPYVLPASSLYALQFPTLSGQHSVKTRVTGGFNSELAGQMLFIAANWVMEQSTKSDLDLYGIWFKWYNGLLQPYCSFFENYGNILKQESEHPVWHSILECYGEITAYHKVDAAHPIPLLSTRLLDMGGCDTLKTCQKRLHKALNGLNLLRLTLWQWQSETVLPDFGVLKAALLPALKSLRCLEDEVLKLIVSSRKLLQIYTRILDYHRSIWKMIVSSQFEGLPVVWNLLRKEILKLQPKFPEVVGIFLMESVNLNNLQDFNSQNSKPTLWIHGGHPLVPSSGRVFYKFQEIVAFSAAVWPCKNLSKKQLDDKQQIIDAMLSANQDLRCLALEGVYIAFRAVSKPEEEESTVLAQLDEIHKSLVRKVEYERNNLGLLLKTSNAEVKVCCSVSSDILCNTCGFNGWLASLPLLNLKSLNLDTALLQCLSKWIQIDSSQIRQSIANSEALLTYAIDYSLELSSRSPSEFTQHKIVWWIHHNWDTVENVDAKFASSLLEIWYNYHKSLWTYCSGSPKVFLLDFTYSSALFPLTHDETSDLAHLTKMDAINTIIRGDLCVMDYQKNSLMLRMSSRSLWEGVSYAGNLVGGLYSAADSLFKQIIFAHKKHFKPEEYSQLEHILFQQSEHHLEDKCLHTACALLSSSSHAVLASFSGSNKLIGSLLLELYSSYSRDSLLHLGAAWVYIGMLRFQLLLSSYNPDPAFLSAFMHSQILEKISLLDLKGKVRHECEELTGSNLAGDCHDQKLMQELKTEEKNLRSKVVFRPRQSKHKSLIAACCEFEGRLSDCKDLVNRICNWQITSRNFIKRLTEEYGEYVDLIQPAQVAVYEMKLGLTIALSGSLEREYLKKVKEDDIEKVLGAVFTFMQFPNGHVAGMTVVGVPDLTNYSMGDQLETQYSEFKDVDILEKLSCVSSQLNVGEVADEVIISIWKMELFSLKKIFDYFESMWINMKSSVKARENDDSQYYKFRSRIIDIQDIFEGDVPSISDIDSDGNAGPDNEEKLELEFFKIMERSDEDDGSVEDKWDLVPESALKCIILTHNQLFGSPDLIEKTERFQISDQQKLKSFVDSYDFGARILKGLPELTSSTLDEKLMPEHLLRVCLEYQRTCAASLGSNSYNAYKDPNPPVLFKMVEPLTALQEKVRTFLDEWPDHPGLLKILEIIASLLAMPLSAPLSKVLLGLQLLAGKAQTLQENDSKFFLKDHLPPIFMLLSSWQRLELECWPILLEEVQGKYETNAAKLWFPLRALLSKSCDIPMNDDLSIIKSIEEFVQTSNLGEFKTRLHLLLAFHGEFSDGSSVGVYLSTPVKKIQNILYNMFGYYMQFLSLVLRQIEVSKESVEKELKDQVKLYRWDQDPYSLASIENFKRTRQKIFKLLQRFNDILKKPVITLLNEEATARKVPCWLDPEISESQFPVDTEKLSERFLWYNKWKSQASLSLQTLLHANDTAVPKMKESVYAVVHNMDHQQDEAELNDRLKFFWYALERICNAADFGSILKHGKKNQKKTALSSLFKTLEECGLSKHRPISHEWGNELDAPSPLFLEQSYNTTHLLQVITQKACEDVSTIHSTLLGANNWKLANQQYFRCLATVQQLKQISLKFNKDLDLQEVNKAASFMNHLLTTLCEQRHLAYDLFEQLNQFRHMILLLGSGGKSESLSSCQNVLLLSMWQQKQFFDNVLAMAMDTNLLLKTFKGSHHASCDNFEVEVAALSTLLEKFITRFSESKDLLDKFLVGSNNILAGAHKNMPLATIEMEQLVAANCQLVDTFREDIQVLCHQDVSLRSVKKVLLSRFEELLDKGKIATESFSRELKDKHGLFSDEQKPEDSYTEAFKETFALAGKIATESFSRELKDKHGLFSDEQKPEDSYTEAFKETFALAVSVVGQLTGLGRSIDETKEPSLEGNITSWKDILHSYVMNLQMDHVCDAGENLSVLVRKLLDYKPEMCSIIEAELMHLRVLLRVILSSAEGILSELLEAHRRGFGCVEDAAEDASDGQKDATGTGTGMGEGEGQESASSKIDDISQLEGTNEMDAQCKADQTPKDDDQAIEMEGDFAAELADVSENESNDSGSEGEDNLDNQMGDTGDASEMVAKKSWDKNEDDDSKTSDEKYESGSLAKGADENDRELRAKDECPMETDPVETDDNKQGKNNNMDDEPSACEDADENTDDVMNKADAYDDRTGPELSELDNDDEDVNMDDTEQTDGLGADNPDNEDMGPEEGHQEDDSAVASEDMEEDDATHDGNNVVDNEGEHDEDGNVEPNNMEKQQLDKMESTTHPSQGIQPNQLETDSNRESEANLANSMDMSSGVAPSVDFSSNEVPSLEISMPNSGEGSRNLSNSKPELQPDAPPSHIKQTDPFRSIGDALEDWKERARVSDDTQDHQPETEHHIDDESATEFRYVPEGEQSTSQALGDATADQINDELQVRQPMLEDETRAEVEQPDERIPGDDKPEMPHLQTSQSRANKSESANRLERRDIQTDASIEDLVQDEIFDTFGDVVSFKQRLTDDRMVQLDALTSDREMSTHMDLDIINEETERAIMDWRNLELATMKLSQELAEQLRLVMEPTLASKLQGDYRTGKRINMRKVIPYIASQFRRDKIWLRRTKPNKRNYQVVIAVDDSRSMSEGKCGKVAIEALVTVCRAMSQLEVGQFAVASFGKRGNVKVLHDFDQIFNAEAGVKMISSLSFEQDNKIEDQPVADLLMHLNIMLDAAVARSRTPSGQNPLQQLILVISDGKFHEKENLRRCIRNVLNRRRMIAYVLLDSHEESIMNSLEACYEGDKLILGKYMDSFPFPYYVMLKNIEALPRTLADLLRQWFELMQSANE
uniref:Midasin n=1 Tax=Aegilops tauschii TaxID=37682 RepID=M8BCY6_AEGTA